MVAFESKFAVGQLIHHKLYDYRGVLVDVDPLFSGTEEWYEQMALTRPPRNEPWYYVLVHGAVHTAYAAEQNLEPDSSEEPINHPEVNDYFCRFENGLYIIRRSSN